MKKTLAMLALSALLYGGPAHALFLLVNVPVDVGDAYTADGVCDIIGDPHTSPPIPYTGLCSLRAAIETANAFPGPHTIALVPGLTAFVTQPLPWISSTVSIYALAPPVTTGAAGPLATIRWAGVGPSPSALVFTSSNNSVKLLSIVGFKDGAAIRLQGGSGSTIVSNYLGIDLTGAAAPNGDGIDVIGSTQNTIGGAAKALRNVISSNENSGIYIQGSTSLLNTVKGNYIGSDPSGTKRRGNKQLGIWIDGAQSTKIGGTTIDEANLIVANEGGGVTMSAGATQNEVLGNYIGEPPVTGPDLGNGSHGVYIVDSHDNRVGRPVAGLAMCGVVPGGPPTTTSGPTTTSTTTSTGSPSTPTTVGRVANPNAQRPPGNVISHNSGPGVAIAGATARANLVQGNIIGLDATGLIPVGNTSNGVIVADAPENQIGAELEGAGNLVSANGKSGIVIWKPNARANRVQANWVGVDCTGVVAQGNQLIGVFMLEAPQTVVGGGKDPARNLVSGNGLAGRYSGIYLLGAPTTKTRVEGNVVGMDRDGLNALANTGNGVSIDGASENDIGGIQQAALFPRNLISGNKIVGVGLKPGAHNNRVRGNYIGPDATGAPPPPGTPPFASAQLVGAWLSNATNNFIGDMDPEGGNVLSNNQSQGVLITYSNAKSNFIWSNLIGTDVSGKLELPNGQSGIGIIDAPDNFIGNRIVGPRNAPGNVISANLAGNHVGAVHITGPGATGNQVRGNYIGTAIDGKTPLPNAYDGVFITDRASKNPIGGERIEHGNVIANNGREGVVIDAGTAGADSTGNSILSNHIYRNKGLGIDLGFDGPSPSPDRVQAGALPNPAPGPNNWQRAPKIHVVKGGIGLLDAVPFTKYRVQFFANDEGDVSGFGQGQDPLGWTSSTYYIDVTTDSEGFSRVPFPLGAAGKVLSATATSPTGDTSEFAKLPCAEAPLDTQLTSTISWSFAQAPAVGSTPSVSGVIDVVKFVDQGPIHAKITVAKANATPDDDLSKVFVRITVQNLAPGAPVSEAEVYSEQQPLDAAGNADVVLDMSNMLKALGAPLNKNFLKAKLYACYRGRIPAVAANTKEAVHIVRDKVIVFLPGVMGSMIKTASGWAYPVHVNSINPLNPGAKLLEMYGPTDPRNGEPKVDASDLTLFTDYNFGHLPVIGPLPTIATVYDVVNALGTARVREKMPTLTIGTGTQPFEYYHIFPWAYDWRLKLEKDVDWLLDGQATTSPTFDNYPSPPSITQILSDKWYKLKYPTESLYGDDHVAIAGHSTGGLIIRSAFTGPRAQTMRGQADRAFFINVPFRGAPKAYYAYTTGDMIDSFISRSMLMDFAPNMPIVYYLAPANGYTDRSGIVPRDLVAKGKTLAGAAVNGVRNPPPVDPATYMDPLIDTANGTATHNRHWNTALSLAADTFHQGMMSREPVIGWRNTKTFYTTLAKIDTPGPVDIEGSGAGQITYAKTRGDETVPTSSQVAGVPDRVQIPHRGYVHQSAANNPTVWANIIRNLNVPHNVGFVGYPPIRDDPNGASPNQCTGKGAAELWGEMEMERMALTRGYKLVAGTGGATGTFRQGFDQVYCDGIYVQQLRGSGYECHGTFIVGEAKGGYRGDELEDIMRFSYGFRQGTIEWAGNSARFAMSGPPRAQAKADPFLKALAAGERTRVEVFHAECGSAPAGSPAPRTRYYQTDRWPY